MRVGAKSDALSLCGPNYEYHFTTGALGLEMLRADWLGPRFDSVRELLEVTEDPVMVPDSASSPRAKSRGEDSQK